MYRSNVFFIPHGGKNGNTTFMETIMGVMGAYSIVGQQTLLLDDGNGSNKSGDVAQLLGVRLAACSETDEGQRFAESKVKRLTGSTKLSAEKKYEHPFEFTATHKLWMDCNHKPRVKNNDDAIWRRITLIPF